jgi:hypothetical protein
VNLQNIRDDIRSVIRDASSEFVTSADVDRWVNTAYRDLAARLKINRQTTDGTGTVGADGDVDPPSDFIEVIWLRLEDDDGDNTVDVEFVDDDVFHSHKDAETTPANTLGRVAITSTGAPLIELYPAPDTADTYQLRYVSDVTDLSGASDEPVIPKHLHRKLVHYGRAEAYYKIGEAEKGDREMVRFEDGLPSVNSGRPRFNPGPASLTLAPGPFDEDEWGVRHR